MPPQTGRGAPADAARTPYGVLLLLAGVVFAAVTTEVLPVGLLPQLARDFGVDEARIGWWVSAYAVVVAAGALPLTAVLARWPRGPVLLLVCLAYATGSTVIATTDSYWVGLVVRLLTGLAHAAVFSVVVATAVAISPPQRVGRAVAIVNSGVALALTLGIPLMTALGTARGWRWSFLVTAAVMVVLAVLIVTVLRAPSGAAGSGALASGRPSVLGELRRPQLLLVAGVTVLLMIGHYSSYTFVTPLSLGAGVPQDRVSLVLFGYGAASIVGLVLAGLFADRFPLAALRLAMVVTGAVLLALSTTGGSAVATALLIAVWGVAFGALPSLLQLSALRATAVADAAPAVINATFNVGIAVGAWAGGLLLVRGDALLTAVSGAVALAALVLTLRLRAAEVRRDEAPSTGPAV